MILEQVKQYNDRRVADYSKAWDKYDPARGGAPFIGLYVFSNQAGDRFVRGWVASGDHGAVYGSNKELAKSRYNKAY